MVGASRLHAFVATLARETETTTVLDVGCGTGTLAGFLPTNVGYLGVDLSESYIEEATRSHPQRTFRRGNVTEMDLSGATFDLGVAIGLLHHIDDDIATHMLSAVSHHLNPGGLFVSIDPCFASGQSILSKAIVGADRGQNVRTPEHYQRLAQCEFPEVKVEVNHRLLRIPFTACILVCRKPALETAATG
jgi:SAM-dependent methyltransferase